MNARKRLLPTAVPSVFPYRSSVGESPAAAERKERLLKRTQQKERRQYGSTKSSTSNAVETVVINPCVSDESMALTEDNSPVAEYDSMIVAKDDSMIIAEDDNMIVEEDDCMIVTDDSMIAAEVVLESGS